MKKTISVLLPAVMCALVLLGCVSTPNYDTMEKDLGIVMPYLMFGDATEGEHDSEAYLFKEPKALTVDSSGNIYVGGKEFTLSKYTPDGEFVKVLAYRGDDPGQINYVKGIVTDEAGNVYATDSINGLINVFDKDGNYVRRFGEVGDVPGKFSDVGPLTLDSDGNIYVSDDAQGVHVFDNSGKFIKMIGNRGEGAGETPEFGWVAVDSELRQLYIAVDGSGKIDVYDIDTGERKFEMGGLGTDPGMWEEDIEGIAVGPDNLVFAIDEAGGNIKVFKADGTFVTQWGKAGLYDGEMASAESIGYDPVNRRIVVADEKNYRVVSFSLDSLGL
jgi:DNA-binding beta-propeller fold protein YncE